PNDLSRSLVALDQDSTIIAVVEMSQSSWLVAGMLPGIERQPRKKLEPSPERLLAVLHRWRDEAVRAGRTITRIALAANKPTHRNVRLSLMSHQPTGSSMFSDRSRPFRYSRPRQPASLNTRNAAGS